MAKSIIDDGFREPLRDYNSAARRGLSAGDLDPNLNLSARSVSDHSVAQPPHLRKTPADTETFLKGAQRRCGEPPLYLHQLQEDAPSKYAGH